MMDPKLLGVPITLLFLYFITYSFLGWCVETTYCCIVERRWVARGFLFGPICPIYGVGVLLMILFFAPLADHLILFYVTATVVMSAWEYLVAWFLETTTKIKYWDYSDKPFNLKGRICLQISLCWGVLSYITIFLIHPHIASLFARIPLWVRYSLFGAVFTLLMVDTITTIRHLALTTQLMKKLEAVGQELMQRSSVKSQLDAVTDRIQDAVRDKDTVVSLKERYDALLGMAERQSRRFRNRYSNLRSDRFGHRISEVSNRGNELRSKLQTARQQRKTAKKS